MNIEQKILNLAKEKKKIQTSDLVSHFGFSRQYLARILKGMVMKGLLVKSGEKKYTAYALPENALFLGKEIKKRFLNENLSEDKVLIEIAGQAPHIYKKDNVGSIFDYAFSEMLNNAIEHSKSKNIEIDVNTNDRNILFIVRDFGIGVFRNIMNKRKLKSELEAIQDLLKGKATTAPQSHSGEGIFFTSKIADEFILESFNLRLRIDNKLDDVFVEEIKPSKLGTEVRFQISKETQKHISNIFEQYSLKEEPGFDKTEIKIKLYTMGTIYISRSQARRILSDLEKFKTVILDFDQVPTVGQAFADEIFRVFKNKHPKITIIPINMNKTVEFMVNRVEKV
jgi:hypothetical protein